MKLLIAAQVWCKQHKTERASSYFEDIYVRLEKVSSSLYLSTRISLTFVLFRKRKINAV